MLGRCLSIFLLLLLNVDLLIFQRIAKPSFCDLPADVKRLNELSNGHACPPKNRYIAKQEIICQSSGCTCWQGQNVEVECDNNRKISIYECDAQTEKGIKVLNENSLDKGCSLSSNGNGNDADNSGADNNDADKNGADKNGAHNNLPYADVPHDNVRYGNVPYGNGAETIGNGFALLMAPLVASLILL